jgi:carbamoyl-phosphate synthase large subunit
MPKRTDIKSILIIGSGPIVIGQACEFDYSGAQACKALREEGYRVILVNSNPATIMTDPEFADRTYIEPLTPEILERVIAREQPDALLPTMGGQTALNLAVTLAETGVLDRYGVELIGAQLDAIRRAEDRQLFKKTMEAAGLALPQSVYVHSREEALAAASELGYPVVLRPSFTLGGAGGNVAHDRDELLEQIAWGLRTSPTHEVLVEASVLGWKEFELEVMRDRKDNVVIICSIENLDPMGVHTGDSITVAPAQTLTDKEYQRMRDAAIRVIRAIGVETGGSNIQFAVHPETGEMVVIEMNPRVSRSSALASKATGFPIAKIAAKLAVGYTLDEIPNDITRVTPACFEPTIDYVVVKIPRFTFEKFPQADQRLTTQMKSVGEAMAIGRTFKEALLKAVRSLEIDRDALDGLPDLAREELEERLRVPYWDRLWRVAEAYRRGYPTEAIARLSQIDPWFLDQIQEIVELEREVGARHLQDEGLPFFIGKAKRFGFADTHLARLLGCSMEEVRRLRGGEGIQPVYKRVDTCGGEFLAHTPYLYSTYERTCEAAPTERKKVVILGGGPNRIGQGIEFDYCCVHAAFALKEEGYETIMVNCNPETVSTDYDTSDRLYFEPLTLEDVLHIVERERPYGVIVQFGGQTPLKLAIPLERAGVPILGTSPDSIDLAENRERFMVWLADRGLRQPESGTARSTEEARAVAARIGYPVMVRPSYVLGGRAMEIVYDEASLREYMAQAVRVSPEHPVLLDRYLMDAVEIDVDALADGETAVIGGIMEHIEEAGVHSGDSACSLPPRSLSPAILREIRQETEFLARELKVVGLMNIQFAVKDEVLYVLEVNPRASRTVPFVSKAIGVPLAKLAAKVLGGRKLHELGFTAERTPPYFAVKEAVFPFAKFPGVDTLLGPEMRSTGEVMGIDRSFGLAYLKSQVAAGNRLPPRGRVFLSVKDADKPAALRAAVALRNLKFQIIATRGTAAYLREQGVEAEAVNKVKEGSPHIVDRLQGGEIDFVINTVHGAESQRDSYSIRRTTLTLGIPYFTTMTGALAAIAGMEATRREEMDVRALQEYYNT